MSSYFAAKHRNPVQDKGLHSSHEGGSPFPADQSSLLESIRVKSLFLLMVTLVSPHPTQAQDAQQEALKRIARYERTLTFIIDDDELLPGQMTVPQGQYRLEFRNHFTSSRLDLAIDDEQGKSIGAAELKEKREKEDLIVNLKPGKYIVFVKQRPKWRCVLTVTEKAKN